MSKKARNNIILVLLFFASQFPLDKDGSVKNMAM